MSNRQAIGSITSSGFLFLAFLSVLGLSGCGGGGDDGSSSTGASADAAVAAYRFRNRDVTNPSIPTNLSANIVSSAQINLAWSASSDNRAVSGYRIRRNGTRLPTLGIVTTFEDSGLTPSTSYSYTVEAIDTSNNVSGQSTAVVAITPALDPTPPTVSATSPANAALDVAVNSAITVTFSEVMMKSTLDATTFKVSTQSAIAINGTVTVNGSSATFTPIADLPAGTQLIATITTGAQDSAGNAIAANFTWNFTTGGTSDTTPPLVSATAPVDAATGVALNSSISATFSEAMTNSSLSTTSFTLVPSAGGAAIGGGVSVAGNTARFTPSVALSAGTQYTATITTAAKDAAGNMLGANYVWKFTTAAATDSTPPTVSSISPATAATGVALNSSVAITFSEPMNNSTLTTTSVNLARTAGGAITGTVNVNGNTVTFTPSASLAAGTQYTASVTTVAKDAAGNALAKIFQSSFTTAAVLDTTPPTVSVTSPASGATNVALNASYTATFSELMTNATLTTASVKLATASGTAVAGTVSVSGNTVTFKPSVDLTGSTQYTGTITTAAKDAAGNALVANYIWSFTTAAAPVTPAPTVSLSANPTSITSGGSSTLTWTSTNATSCTASGAWSGSKATAGSQASGTLTSSSTFTLNCTGAGGSSGDSATITVTGASATKYTTDFLLTENPVSEGGKWINGGAVGLDWHNPLTASGNALASVRADADGTRYADDIAVLTTSFSPNQYAQAVVYRAAGYNPGTSKHEVELLLRFTITAHDAHGYEILWGHEGYLDIVRWNGPISSYLQLNPSEPNLGDLADGDVLRAEINGNVITAYKNGTLVMTQDISGQGTVWSTGQPGMGFWPVDSATPANLGMKSYEAGSL